MLTLPRLVVALTLSVPSGSGVDSTQAVVVTGDRVCLRARPDGQSEVVWQASSGTVLQSTTVGSNWVEVLAPEKSSVWIAAELVSNGTVQVSKAYLRAGPGKNYQVVGTADRNDRLEVRQEDSGWLRARPTAACRLWVSRLFVKPAVPDDAASRPSEARPVVEAGTTVAAPVPAPPPPVERSSVTRSSNGDPVVAPTGVATGVVTAEAVRATGTVSVAADTARGAPAAQGQPVPETPAGPLPSQLAKYEVDEDADQGRRALYRGTMDRCNWLFRGPAEYRLLVRHPRRGVVTLCYVIGDSALLAPMEGKRVAVSGREYRFKRVDRPVVVYESVLEDSDGAGSVDVKRDER